MSTLDHPDLRHRIEHYLDSVPRGSATAEEIGPFTLFVATDGWPYYARPTLGWQSGRVQADDVRRVVARQESLGVPVALEWLADLAPDLSTACRDAELSVIEHPLLVHHDPIAVPVPDGIRIRRLDADDPAVDAGQVVAELGFATSGTARGPAGPVERDDLLAGRAPAASAYVRTRLHSGASVMVVAEDEHGVLSSGLHQPVSDVTEIVGVATLPAARRRGLGAAVTATLVADAIRRHVDVVFLTAGSDDIARVYERVGFRRVGTAMAAAPPA